MNVFKSLCGSLVGVAIATTIYFFVKPENVNSTYWFPVLAGILSGLGAGMLGGSNRSNVARIVSGGLAAAVAGITMIGVDVAPALLNNSDGRLAAPASRDVSGKLPSAKEERVTETAKENVGADKVEVADGKSSGSSDTAATDAGSQTDSSADKPEPVSDSEKKLANDFGADRADRADDAQSRGQLSGQSSGFGEEALAEIQRKRKWDRWLQVIMPAIGILLAYQFARGFRDDSTVAAK